MNDVSITYTYNNQTRTSGWKLCWTTNKGAPMSKTFVSLQDATDHYYFVTA